MVDAPQQTSIQNVLAMNEPQHMLAKLLWEIRELSKTAPPFRAEL
jgi:hypothetical protein